MDEAYRLVFRGEVLDGQHPAVVKQRLIDALNLSDDQAEKLFSGSTVVLKRDADTKTAARYQGLFKKAGARLRVLPVEEGALPKASQPAAAADPAQRSESVDSSRGMQVLPVGADILGADERPRAPVVQVDISHLEIQLDESAWTPESATPPTAVAVPEFSVAEPGVNLVEHHEPEAVNVDPHFDLAEPGADIPTIPVDQTPAVDIAEIRFDVAERGADIGVPRKRPQPVAPDTSHLSLVAE